MKKKTVIIIAIAVAVLGYFWWRSRSGMITDDAENNSDGGGFGASGGDDMSNAPPAGEDTPDVYQPPGRPVNARVLEALKDAVVETPSSNVQRFSATQTPTNTGGLSGDSLRVGNNRGGSTSITPPEQPQTPDSWFRLRPPPPQTRQPDPSALRTGGDGFSPGGF